MSFVAVPGRERDLIKDPRVQLRYDANSYSSNMSWSYVSRTAGKLKGGSVTSKESERVVNLTRRQRGIGLSIAQIQ